MRRWTLLGCRPSSRCAPTPTTSPSAWALSSLSHGRRNIDRCAQLYARRGVNPKYDSRDLRVVRAAELAAAADALTVSDVRLLDHADGGLDCVDLDVLVDDIVRYVRAVGAHGLLVFDLGGSRDTAIINGPQRRHCVQVSHLICL